MLMLAEPSVVTAPVIRVCSWAKRVGIYLLSATPVISTTPTTTESISRYSTVFCPGLLLSILVIWLYLGS